MFYLETSTAVTAITNKLLVLVAHGSWLMLVARKICYNSDVFEHEHEHDYECKLKNDGY